MEYLGREIHLKNLQIHCFIQYKKLADEYKSNYHEYCFPKKFGFEPFKMKKYDSNGVDEFGWHVDVNSRGSMHRWLGFFLYLSDNEEGKTEFPYQNTITDCKKGSMVVFPPMWLGFIEEQNLSKNPNILWVVIYIMSNNT